MTAAAATGPVNVNPVPSGGQPAALYDCSKAFCFGLAQEPVAFLQQGFVFDPANLVDRPSLQISRQLYETLFEFKPADMQYQYANLIKYVAESEDKLTYTIRTGKGLRFSDDTPLNAAAIKFNFERWSDPGNLYHKGAFQTWGEYFGGFPGNLASVRADESSNTVTIKLKRPMGNFFQVLAMPQFAIVAPSAFNHRTGIMERSVGSSWYVLDKVVRSSEGKYAVLRENKQYHVERYDVDNPQTPFVKSPTIIAVVLKQNQDGLEEVRRGALAATDKIRPEQVAPASKEPALKLLERRPLSVAFLSLNHTRAPFDNSVVRQAFAAAIDTRTLVRDYYYGLGQAASMLLPPTALAYLEGREPYPYDPERARRLLNNAGYNATNPLTLDLWVLPVPRAYYPDPRKVADAIAADLAKVGVRLTVRDSKSWPLFRTDRLNGEMELYMYGWQGQNGDPHEFLGEFYGQQRGEGGYENPALRELVQRGSATTDLRERRIYYRQAQELIYEQVPVIPLAYVKGMVAVRPSLKGYVPHPTGIESWAEVKVDS